MQLEHFCKIDARTDDRTNNRDAVVIYNVVVSLRNWGSEVLVLHQRTQRFIFFSGYQQRATSAQARPRLRIIHRPQYR
jgi:hypothetical protein